MTKRAWPSRQGSERDWIQFYRAELRTMGAVPHKRARGENNSEYEDRLSTQHDRACERLTPRPVADAVTSEMPGIDCPACGERVARGSLREHLIKLHGRKPGQFLAKAPPAGGVKKPRH
jgi:hypothetical protein